MMALYTRTTAASDPVVVLYYNIVLTVVTVLAALIIGVLQVLSLILNAAQPTGRFWDGVSSAGDHYDIIGGSICGSFIVFGAISVVCYKPWRRHVEKRRPRPAAHVDGPTSAEYEEELVIVQDEDAIQVEAASLPLKPDLGSTTNTNTPSLRSYWR